MFFYFCILTFWLPSFSSLSFFVFPGNLLLLPISTGLESGLRPLDGKILKYAISDIAFFQFSPNKI